MSDDHNDHITLEERYGPGLRFLRRWSLDEEGRAICILDALDITKDSAEDIANAIAGNEQVRFALGLSAATITPLPSNTSITPLQARKALRVAGLRELVNDFLSKQSDEVVEAWEYCVEVQRDNQFITMAQEALGLNDDQVDDLFRLGSQL